MRKGILLLILFIALKISAMSQSEQLLDITGYTACETALEISTLKQVGPTNPPAGIKSLGASLFEQEKHLVWYKFKTERSGKLLFDIIPLDTLDNYDFILYKADANFCTSFKTNPALTPLRQNFNRVDLDTRGRTGLSVSNQGKTYSEAIDVKENEYYYLVLNNMFANGKGHTLIFTYLEAMLVTGEVYDAETNLPIIANVTWENTRTREILGICQSGKNGKFSLQVSISTEAHKFPNYVLTVYTDKYIYADSIVPSKMVATMNRNFVFKMKKIVKGKNTFFGNIYFEPNDALTIPTSYIEISKLIKMMRLNTNITVQLEGHTNGFYPSTDVDERLSEARAISVKDLIVKEGISSDRILTKGMGSTQLMYEKAKDEIEEGLNRRVEIKILKF